MGKHLVVITTVIYYTSKTIYFYQYLPAYLTDKILLPYRNEAGNDVWYKFDDGEVTECKIHEDEELKTQCYGGDYMGEVYDNHLKRIQYRRQKRWWNAYMLFYTSVDQKEIKLEPCIEQLSLAESKNFRLPMPSPIEKSLRLQNIKFLHSRSLFSTEFFSFIRNLVGTVIPRSEKLVSDLINVQLCISYFHIFVNLTFFLFLDNCE